MFIIVLDLFYYHREPTCTSMLKPSQKNSLAVYALLPKKRLFVSVPLTIITGGYISQEAITGRTITVTVKCFQSLNYS